MDKVITDYFTGALCINLDDRPERMVYAQSEFDRLGLRVERKSATKGNAAMIETKLLPNEVGCKISHLGCITNACIAGWDSVLVFEDDVVFRDGANELFNEYMQQMPDDWTMIYLGGNHWGWNLGEKNSPQLERVTENVWRTKNTLTTHAYAMRRSVFIEAVGLLVESDKPVDVVYGEIQKRHPVYALRPNLAWQRDGWSDINNKKCSYYFIKEW